MHSTGREVGLRVPTFCVRRAPVQCNAARAHHRSAESTHSTLRGLQSFIGPARQGSASLCSLPLRFGDPDPTSWPLGSKAQVREGVTWPLEAPHHLRQEGRPGGEVLWFWEDPGFLLSFGPVNSSAACFLVAQIVSFIWAAGVQGDAGGQPSPLGSPGAGALAQASRI